MNAAAQNIGRRKRVGSGKRPVCKQICAISAARKKVEQHALYSRDSHADYMNPPAVLLFQLKRLFNREQIERIDYRMFCIANDRICNRIKPYLI